MTIDDLLLNSFFRGNQTLLAKTLNVTRNTLRKYMGDKEGENHMILLNRKTKNPELFINTSVRI